MIKALVAGEQIDPKQYVKFLPIDYATAIEKYK